MQEKQEELWLAVAPRGLPDWLVCCYLVERGAPFPSQARWPPTVSIASLTTYTFTLAKCQILLCHDGKASPARRHRCTHLSIVSLRVCLNNNPPPHTDNPPPLSHLRWQHLQVSWLAREGGGVSVESMAVTPHCSLPGLSSHFITNICHCPPLCCRSIPFEGLTGVNTVPASCGDWWLRGSNAQVHPVLRPH